MLKVPIMDHEQAIFLALIQGISEFLPISSSAHLVAASQLLGWQDQGLRFDIAVHVGSLLAILLYCRHEVMSLIVGAIELVTLRWTENGRLLLFFILASLPLLAAGFYLHKDYPALLRSIPSIAVASAVFAVFLWVADRYSMTVRELHHIRARTFIFIGLGQILALIPGVSRAGIVITCARMIGFSRESSARMAFLLAIPALAGAGFLEGWHLVFDDSSLNPGALVTFDLLVVAILSFIFSLLAVVALMRWIGRYSYTPFVVYRLIFAAVLVGATYADAIRAWIS